MEEVDESWSLLPPSLDAGAVEEPSAEESEGG